MRSVACAPLIASAVAPRLAPSMSLRIATAAAPSATQLSGLVPVRSYRSGVTKSSVKKRFRLKASGLIVRHKANKRHINRHKSSARLNRLSESSMQPFAQHSYPLLRLKIVGGDALASYRPSCKAMFGTRSRTWWSCVGISSACFTAIIASPVSSSAFAAGWAPLANTGYRKKYKEMLMIGRGVKR